MRAKEAAQPVAAIAADEPSEAGSTASELANGGGPKGWSGEHTKRSAVRNRRPQSGWRREDTPKGRPQRRNTAQALAQGGAKEE